MRCAFHDEALGGLGLGAGVRYKGESEETAYTLAQPDYSLYDAAIIYDLKYLSPSLRGAQLNLNVNNLFDKYYVTNCGSGLMTCFLGSERSFLGTVSYKW